MFKNIPLLILAYLGIGTLFTMVKMWRLAMWYDYVYLEEPRGFESEKMIRSTLREFYALPYPPLWQFLTHIVAWPFELMILAFAGGSLLLMWTLLIATFIIIGAIVGIGYLFIGLLWILCLPFRKRS